MNAREVLTRGKLKPYTEQLVRSEWREFTAELIRERGNFCENCRLGGKTLQVHHVAYTPGRPPEDEPKENFIVLCKSCHEELHEELIKFRRFVFRHLKGAQFRILNGALAVGLTHHDPLEFVHAVAEIAASPGSVRRFAYAWNGGKTTTEETKP